MSDEMFAFDVTVIREEPNFDRACDQVRKMVDEEIEKRIEVHEQNTRKWLEKDSVAIVFRGYENTINHQGSIHSYVFNVVARLNYV